MAPHTQAWKFVLAFVVFAIGAAIAIPLGRYAERDDAPGGEVIAMLILFGALALAIWIVAHRPGSQARK